MEALRSQVDINTQVKVLNHSVVSYSLRPVDCSLPVFCVWDFPGKNTGVGCHALLQGILLTQGPRSSAL